jgi:hypothetical protein
VQDIDELVGDSVGLRRDLFRLLVGECIGGGAHREVYKLRGREDYVLKAETGSASFYNVLEWETWLAVLGTKFEKYFAPCETISPCGMFLIQERTSPVRDVPKAKPKFLQDIKPENFGMLKNGRVVCHDYSISWLIRANLRGMNK